MSSRTAVVALALVLAGASASAQEPPQKVPSWSGRNGLLTWYAFNLGLETLSGDDPRFQWDFDLGGEVDVLRVGPGRVNLAVNFENVLGEILQRFDPIFGNYTIDTLGGATTHGVEVAAVFHHVSRHLGDRPKPFGIAWNMLGVRAMWLGRPGGIHVQARGWAQGTVNSYFVDYSGEVGGDVLAERAFNDKVSALVRGTIDAMFIDGSKSERGTQVGGRVEGAVRLSGTGAAVEFYVAADRRIDADPFERRPVTWAVLGLRLVNR
jgi:hypothetical protein